MNRITTPIALLAVAFAASATPAVATHLIEGKDIRDNTVTTKDIRNGTVAEVDLDAKVRTKLNNVGHGIQGERGATGATGIQGPRGTKGDPGEDGAMGAKGATGEGGARGAKGDTGERGPTGPRGFPGDPGPAGPAGQDGASGHTIVNGELFLTQSDGRHTIGKDCPTGKVPVGGGFQTNNSGTPVVVSSYPENNGWRVQFDASVGVEVRPYVICITNG